MQNIKRELAEDLAKSVNPTIQLLRIIGSPFVSNPSNSEVVESEQLYNYAFKNRVEPLYLMALKKRHKLKKLQAQFETWEYRYKETLVTVARVARVLNNANIDYVIFKTIRPYPATANDIDIIFLGPGAKYKQAMQVLIDAGYIELGQAPLQVLFSDPRGLAINERNKSGGIYYIDFYEQAGVDYFVYFDKNKLRQNIIFTEVAGYNGVKTLTPEVDLATILMHSVFPENSYGLEIFYTTLYYFKNWDEWHLKQFLRFAKINYIIFPVKVSLTITAILHKQAYGNIPEILLQVLDRLGGMYKHELNNLNKKFKTPYKFSYSTFFKTFIYKLAEVNALKSLGMQAIHMLNPVFAFSAFKSLYNRLEGKVYLHV